MASPLDPVLRAADALAARGDVLVLERHELPPPPADVLAAARLPPELGAVYACRGGFELAWDFADTPGTTGGHVRIPRFSPEHTRFAPADEWQADVLRGPREILLLDDHQDRAQSWVVRPEGRDGPLVVVFSCGRWEGDTVLFRSVEAYLADAAASGFAWYWQRPDGETNRETKRLLRRLAAPPRKVPPIAVGLRVAARVNHDLLRGEALAFAAPPPRWDGEPPDPHVRIRFDLGATAWAPRLLVAPVRADVYETLRHADGWRALAAREPAAIVRTLADLAPPEDPYFSGNHTPYAQRLTGLLAAVPVDEAFAVVVPVARALAKGPAVHVDLDDSAYLETDVPIEGGHDVPAAAVVARLVEALLHRLLLALDATPVWPPSTLLAPGTGDDAIAWLRGVRAHHRDDLVATLRAAGPEALPVPPVPERAGRFFLTDDAKAAALDAAG